MHETQKKLLELTEKQSIGSLSLREIGALIGELHPQKIQHHLNQLKKKGLIKIDKTKNIIERVKQGLIKNAPLFSILILGSANCGEATIIAEEHAEGLLTVSRQFLNPKKGLFALKAVGISMNRANINGKSIDDGDYVIIDSKDKKAKNNDYILSIIDGMANIKKLIIDKTNHQIVLLSESSQDFPPIFIHEQDFVDYFINGKVVQVIKKPKYR